MAKIKEGLTRFKNFCLHLFYPKEFTCDFCGKELDTITRYNICEDCNSYLTTNSHICKKCGSEIDEQYEYCQNCKNKQVYYKFARAPFKYDGEIKTSIHNFKYSNAKYLASSFSNFMTDTIIQENYEFDLLIPVPLTKQREKYRGYNQSLLLCEQISKNLHVPVLKDCLIRNKFITSQTKLSFEERYKNLEDCFEITNPALIKGKKILLIDDVMTTGATVEACSKLLMENGANIVYICTIARTSSKSTK